MVEHGSPSDPEQVAAVKPVPITARDVRDVVRFAIAKDDPTLYRRMLNALSTPHPEQAGQSPSLLRALAWARRTVTRHLADRISNG